MAETAAHLADHVLPRLPVRQWVLSLPKRLRYHLQYDREALNSALRLFLDAQRLIYHLPKPGPAGQTQIILSPLELIGRIAALVPPPRQHRHRYYGVLAPNLRIPPQSGHPF